MAQKKKNPYQQAQRQFVQKRAQEKGFEELTVDQREQLRNRFQQLASTQKGRTTIAQKLLSNATPEERKQFKQKLAQNIPSRASGGITSTGTSRTTTTTGKTTQIGDAATRNLQRMKPVVKAAAPAAQPKKQDERWGKGFFSVPKSLKGIAKEFGIGAYESTVGALESQSATFVNPAVNKALRGVEMVGGVKKGELGRFREARAAEAYTNVAFAALAAPQVGAVGRAGLRIGLDVASGVAGKAGLKNISVGLGIKRAESLGIEAARRCESSSGQSE